MDGYLRRMPHPEGVREAVSDTAGAAQMIADHGWRCASAVVASVHALNPCISDNGLVLSSARG